MTEEAELEISHHEGHEEPRRNTIINNRNHEFT
jgi:hypothetical protein